MKVVFDLYGNMDIMTINNIIDELKTVKINTKYIGDDKLLVKFNDLTHVQAFKLGTIVENVVNYHYGIMVDAQTSTADEQGQMFIPFTVEALQDIVY